MLELYILSWVLAACSYTYVLILTDVDMILSPVRLFLYRKLGEDNWLFKILIGCEYCVAGQSALWSYLLITIFEPDLFDKIGYNPFIHLAVVLITIFNVAIINKAGIYGNE